MAKIKMAVGKRAFSISSFLRLFLVLSLFVASILLVHKVLPSTEARTELPDKGIVFIQLDDTYKSAYTKAFPILQSRGWRGGVYINPYSVGRNYKMNLNDLVALNQAGWDVSSHGWSHVNPTTLTPEELDQHLRGAYEWLMSNGFTKGARHYAPPQGVMNQTVYDEAIKYYSTIKVVPDGPFGQFLLMPPNHNYNMIVAHDAKGWSFVKGKIDALNSNQDVLALTYHDVVDVNPVGNQTSIAFLNQTFDYLTEKGVNVITLSAFVDGLAPGIPTPFPPAYLTSGSLPRE